MKMVKSRLNVTDMRRNGWDNQLASDCVNWETQTEAGFVVPELIKNPENA